MPSVTISEHTERPDFINLLKEKLGIKFRVFQEIIIKDNLGSRHQADIIIFDAEKINVDLKNGNLSWTSEDAVVSLIETKIQTQETLEPHEPQLFNYLRMFNCKIGFLTNYKSVASYVIAPDYSSHEKEIFNDDDLENIAYFIVDILEKVAQISIQRSPEEIMNFLELNIDDLTLYTSRISGDEWEKYLRLSDASEIEEKKKELSDEELEEREKFLQRSAAYIAITQIMFYITFRQFRIDENININPKLAPLSAANGIPTQLQELLEEVPNNNLNFKAIFGKNKEVFTHLDDDSSTILHSIVKILEGVSAKFVIENDLIGQIFQRLMPYETRKKFAAYYTLGHAAELMCRLAIQDQNDIVYDPACGSGTLLVNTYKRKRELGAKQHKTILEQIRGSDISDVATMMSTINLAIQDPSKWTNHVNIFQFDAIDFSFGLTRFQQHFRETPNGREFVDPDILYNLYKPVDVLLANPPFTRGSRLTQTQRNKLRNLPLVTKYRLNLDFSRMNFYAFFILIAPSLVNKTGKIAFILPQGAINSQSMINIWNIIFKEKFGIKYLIEASDIEESFSDSKDQEIIIILEKKYEGKVKLVKLLGELKNKSISRLVHNIDKEIVPYNKTEDYVIQVLNQNDIKAMTCMEWNLNPSKILTLAYDKFIPLASDKLLNSKKLYDNDLKHILKIITENASRPVDYWFIPNKYWDIKEVGEKYITIKATSRNSIVTRSNQEMKLPKIHFIPAISRSLRYYQHYTPIVSESNIENYYLTDEKGEGLELYYEWGSEGHKKGLFGIRHGNHAPAKNAGGVIKRIDFSIAKTLALRFEEPKMGTQIIRFGFYSEDKQTSDLFFAYLSSSLFILDALTKSRKRRAEFVIINQIDFYSIYLFPNLHKILKNQDIVNTIIKRNYKLYGINTIASLDPIHIQIRNARTNSDNPRRKLDETWFKVLNIPLGLLDGLYQEIEEKMNDILKKRTCTQFFDE